MTTFDQLGLIPALFDAINERGFVTPTPIQAERTFWIRALPTCRHFGSWLQPMSPPAGLDRDELLQRFISVEFNRFPEQYGAAIRCFLRASSP